MPVRIGEMMVVVRAQDFASRTLRRVGGELAGLSQAQQLQMRREQLAFQARQAQSRVDDALRNREALRTVDAYNKGLARQAKAFDELQRAERNLQRVRDTRGTSIRRLQQEIAMARQELDFFREARRLGVTRKVMSPAQRVAGMEQASHRLKNAHDALAKAARVDMVAHQNAARALANATSRYNQASNAVKRYGDQISRLPGWLRSAATSTFGYQTALNKVNRELDTAYNNLTRSQQAQLAFNNAMAQLPAHRLANVGHALSGIGRTMQLVGLIGTGVFGAMSAAFADFNREATLAATQAVDPFRSNWKDVALVGKQLQTVILDLMRTFPATASEMSKAAYDIFSSMDVNFSGGIQLLRKFNMLAVATMTDLETATNAGITVLNNFGGSTKDINSTLNLMVATVRFGRMRLEDFNTMLNKVAPAAASAGNSLKDVAGAMALITTRQPSQRQAATGIARLFQVFQDPDFQEGVRQASGGMVDIVKAAGGLKPLPVIVNQLAAAFKETSTVKGAAQLFRELTATGRGAGRGLRSTIEAQRAWTFLFKNLKAYNDLQKRTTKDNRELARAFKAMSESPGVRWQVMINQFRILVLLIGEKAIPVFLQIGDAIGKLIDWFKRMNREGQLSFARWAAFASVGLLLAGVILGIAGPIVAMIAHLKMWRMGLGQTEARVLTLTAVLRKLPFIGLGVLLQQMVGLKRAIFILTAGWIAWKVVAVTAAGAIAAANAAAATTVTVVWKTAIRRILASTGVGLLVLAFGLAAEHIIMNWEKVREYFRDFWDEMRMLAIRGARQILEPFSMIKGPLGQWARDAENRLNEALGGIEMAGHLRDEMREWDLQLDKFLKTQPKKFLTLMRDIRKQINIGRTTGETPAGTTVQSLQKELDRMEDAVERRKARMKASGKDTQFSKEYWSLLAKGAKDYSGVLEKLYGKQVEGEEEVIRKRKELANVTSQATTDIIGSMRSMYTNILQQNEQAMGELFKGPWLTSETFNLAQEWGITPRIQDMIRDLREQNSRFAAWRSSLDKLIGRGLPKGFIDELRAMGPESQPLIDQILSAKPGQVRSLIGQWKRRQQEIQRATKMDFTAEIKAFRRAGLNMGDAIVNGFKQAQVGKWFDAWVKVTFPGIINAAVAQAVKDWKASQEGATAKPKPAPPKPTRAMQGAGNNTRTTNNTNNARTIVYNDYSHPGSRGAPDEAHKRRKAFNMKNAARNVM